MKKLPRRLLVVSASFVFALGVMECVLRMTDVLPMQRNPISGFHEPHPRLGWIGVSDYAARFRRPDFDVVVEFGSDGFRAPSDAPLEIEEDALRVAVLGDSFVWGWGVGQGETVSDRLQEQLGGTVRVRNYGVNAYSTGQELLLLEELVLDWQPDVVLLMFFHNDLEDNSDEKGGRRPWFELVDGRAVARNVPVRRDISGLFRGLSRRSAALSFLRFNANQLGARWKESRKEAAAAEAQPAAAQRSASARQPSASAAKSDGDTYEWRLFRAILDDLQAACSEHPSAPELRVVYIPTRKEVAWTRRAPRSGAGVLEVACAERSIPYVDLAPGLRARWQAHPQSGPRGLPIYLPIDGHWDVAGHSAAAAVLVESMDWDR